MEKRYERKNEERMVTSLERQLEQIVKAFEEMQKTINSQALLNNSMGNDIKYIQKDIEKINLQLGDQGKLHCTRDDLKALEEKTENNLTNTAEAIRTEFRMPVKIMWATASTLSLGVFGFIIWVIQFLITKKI